MERGGESTLCHYDHPTTRLHGNTLFGQSPVLFVLFVFVVHPVFVVLVVLVVPIVFIVPSLPIVFVVFVVPIVPIVFVVLVVPQLRHDRPPSIHANEGG